MDIIIRLTKKTIVSFALLLLTSAVVFAVAPSDEVVQSWKDAGIYEAKMAWLNSLHEKGVCNPAEYPLTRKHNSLSAGTEIDTVRVILIMVDFSDHPWDGQAFAGTPADFDSILFSEGYVNPSGSMVDYYLENSYGQFYIIGDIKGWYRMPQTYAYYVDAQSGFGTYPQNAQKLVEDACAAANTAGTDFSLYDYDNNAVCDGVILIHSGPGAEVMSSPTDLNHIWSHNWQVYTPTVYDGVQIIDYNINPEEYGSGTGAELSPIGVFCHEYGHFLGLPDLYDTDGTPSSSEGLGSWSLMASGNYNGPGRNSRFPAHFDPWCKEQLGFITINDLTSNLYNVGIPTASFNPVAYKLQDPTMPSDEYFLVENRQRSGFDTWLPDDGLLIYHVDESQPNNNDFLHYKVALEQADGLDGLALIDGDRGGSGDPYPNTSNGNYSFNEFTFPGSHEYSGLETEVSVWDISDSDSIMYVDLDVTYSRPWIEEVTATPFNMVDADMDDILEPGETVDFYFSIINRMRSSYNVHATLTAVNSGVQFTTNNITVNGTFGNSTFSNTIQPIQFTVPDTLTPKIDSFYLTITTDSLDGVPGGVNFTHTFGFEVTLGQPNILIVDDDGGASYQDEYVGALYDKRVPSDIWDINASGTPAIGDIQDYDMVFWHTGTNATGVINAAEIALMKQYMDAGKNLMLSTVMGVNDIIAIDSAFLNDYFKANKDSSILWPEFFGVSGNPVSDSLKMFTLTTNFYTITTLTPTGEGEPAFMTGNPANHVCGVSYDGSYKSLLLTFSVDVLDDNRTTHNTKSDLIAKVVDFFGGVPTSIFDGTSYNTLPDNFVLSQNYPNPFNPTTTINYTLHPTTERGAKTKLEIFNVLGQNIKTLVNKVQIPGSYSVEWDGTNKSNQEVASGIYLYRISRGNISETKKMTLLK